MFRAGASRKVTVTQVLPHRGHRAHPRARPIPKGRGLCIRGATKHANSSEHSYCSSRQGERGRDGKGGPITLFSGQAPFRSRPHLLQHHTFFRTTSFSALHIFRTTPFPGQTTPFPAPQLLQHHNFFRTTPFSAPHIFQDLYHDTLNVFQDHTFFRITPFQDFTCFRITPAAEKHLFQDHTFFRTTLFTVPHIFQDRWHLSQDRSYLFQELVRHSSTLEVLRGTTGKGDPFERLRITVDDSRRGRCKQGLGGCWSGCSDNVWLERTGKARNRQKSAYAE